MAEPCHNERGEHQTIVRDCSRVTLPPLPRRSHRCTLRMGRKTRTCDWHGARLRLYPSAGWSCGQAGHCGHMRHDSRATNAPGLRPGLGTY